MAQSMKDIQDKIYATRNMGKIASAMQMVASAKLVKAEQKVSRFRSYMETLEEMIADIHPPSHPIFETRESGVTGYLAITSDRGLAGGYNANILKQLQVRLGENPSSRIYLVGHRGFDYASQHGYAVENEDKYVPDNCVYNDMRFVIDKIFEDFNAGSIGRLIVIYTDYHSKILQVVEEKQVLPLPPPEKNDKMEAGYLFEPSEESILDNLVPQYIEGMIYGALMVSKLSEQAARMNTMQHASDNAGDIIHELQLTYNRARQSHITEEINEIVGGAAAI